MTARLCYRSILFLLLLPCMSIAQVSPVKSIGNVNNVNINGQQVDITTDNAHAQVTVYSANVVRVRIDKQALQPDFSYAVITQPQTVKANITQDAGSISISTDSLKVQISKTPFAVTFYTKDGEVISQDETGLTTSWVNESVTTYKKMQDGDRFIGLGEKPVPLNRKGNG